MAIPPPWPRPVSPLQYESLAPEAHHEIYLDDSSSSEDEDRRTAKRRRIEQLGERYLRGYGLEISTARIRGPLGENWKNPWRKIKRKAAVEQETKDTKGPLSKEVPETVHKADPVLATNALKGNQQLQRPESFPKSHEVTHLSPAADQTRQPQKSPPRVQQGAVEDDPFTSTNALKSKDKVEHWLKRDQGIMRSRLTKESEGPLSPTARFTAINTMRTGLSRTVKQPPADPISPQKDQNQEATSKELISSFKPEILDRDLHPHPADTKFIAQNDTTKAKIEPTGQVVEVVIPSVDSLDNGIGHQSSENLIKPPEGKTSSRWNGVVKIRAKRRSSQAVPPSTNLSEFEFRRVARHSDEKHMQLDEKNNTLTSSKAPSQKKVMIASEGHINQPDDTENPPPAQKHEASNGKKHSPSPRRSELQVDSKGYRSISSDPLLQSDKNLPTTDKDAGEKMKPPPLLSLNTETSNKTDTTVTNNLPSAQVVPNPQGPILQNSLPSTKLEFSSKGKNEPQAIEEDRTEDSILYLSTQAAVERAQKKFQAELETPKPHATTMLQRDDSDAVKEQRAEEGPEASTDVSKLSPSYHTPQDPDTQAMLDAISPFDFSTTKKVPLKSADSPKSKPATVTKAHSTKTKKRASFALDAQDSDGTVQSSIRSALKVTKRAGIGGGEDLPSEKHQKGFLDDGIHFGSLDDTPNLNMSTSTEASANAKSSNATNAASKSLPSLSSLLRPGSKTDIAEDLFPTALSTEARNTTFQNRAAPTTTNPTPSSSKLLQDAQPEAHAAPDHRYHRNHLPAAGDSAGPVIDKENDNNGEDKAMGLGLDAFDLEATMDDIGSFLQSWDTEKEAKVVQSASGGEGASVGSGFSGSGSGGVSGRERRDWKKRRWAEKEGARKGVSAKN